MSFVHLTLEQEQSLCDLYPPSFQSSYCSLVAEKIEKKLKPVRFLRFSLLILSVMTLIVTVAFRTNEVLIVTCMILGVCSIYGYHFAAQQEINQHQKKVIAQMLWDARQREENPYHI